MEALTAIGLVGNIVQLLDFVFKILAISNELHRSGSDGIRSNQNLEIISAEMKRLSSSLINARTITPIPDNEKGLVNLAVETERCASELLSLLGKLKSRDSTKRLQNLRAAFRNLRKYSEKAQLKKDLDNCVLKSSKSLREWLCNGNGVFHLSGKPGAGKSTLMKFLCQNEKTTRYLETWAEVKKLIFAKAFFWRQGSDYQKSWNGLLRCILYQVLATAPDLIPDLYPEHWAQSVRIVDSSLRDIDPTETFETLVRSDLTYKERKFVFFIDALDEYDGSLVEMVNRLLAWTKMRPTNLKICVSSREWNEFTFHLTKYPRLRLHECTQEDITRVVSDKLEEIQRQYRPFEQDEDISHLSRKIVRKAEGVFIWVKLVLNAVEDGALNGDNISDLEKKADAFPRELDSLYQYLFDSIREDDRQKAFEAIRMTHYFSPYMGLPLIRYWFLNNAIADSDFAIKTPVHHGPENMQELHQRTRRQIYGRCKGFLEVGPPAKDTSPDDFEVKYMHSTVHEFLSKPHIKQSIDNYTGDVDIPKRICQTFLASVKLYKAEYFDSSPTSNLGSPFNRELLFITACADKQQRHSSKWAPRDWFLDFWSQLEVAAVKELPEQALVATI
ncbi:hypothetical protein F4810DRAFT_713369 [Camillea tinctor]|nr:hypothetical protein F4810DRAFT_713369 [Camillea tinctor]